MAKNIIAAIIPAVFFAGVAVASGQSCEKYSDCGLGGQWSCVNGRCRGAACGDGFCNACEFSPCESASETSVSCPQDCGDGKTTTPTPDPEPLPDSKVPSEISGIPVLKGYDPNMRAGKAIGIQRVGVGGHRYYAFVLEKPCNRVDVNWVTFDWKGRIDMLVKAGFVPTNADWKSAIAKGYPAKLLTSPLWYNLLEYSGDGGERIAMQSVPAWIYFIMMKNTGEEKGLYKVWYNPDCDYVERKVKDNSPALKVRDNLPSRAKEK